MLHRRTQADMNQSLQPIVLPTLHNQPTALSRQTAQKIIRSTGLQSRIIAHTASTTKSTTASEPPYTSTISNIRRKQRA